MNTLWLVLKKTSQSTTTIVKPVKITLRTGEKNGDEKAIGDKMTKIIIDAIVFHLLGMIAGLPIGIAIGMKWHKEIKKILTRGQK